MELGLTGKVALVSGGSRGIGFAIAQALVREGCRVAIVAREEAGLSGAAAEIGQNCSVHRYDMCAAGTAEAVIAEVADRWGGLDILVTNVGSGRSVPPGHETEAEWRRMIDLNLFSASSLIAAARPLLSRGAAPAIVCVSSICGREAIGAPVAYMAAKAALEATVKGLMRPLAAEGIRINVVAPGNIWFPGGVWDRKITEDEAGVTAMLISEVPLARFGSVESVADAVLFLASPRSFFTTGSMLVVDGGQTRSW